MKIIDNTTEFLKENLIAEIKHGDKVSIAASCFSMYAFRELKEQLESVDEFRFLFTTPMYIKEDRDIGDSSLFGTKSETKLRNALMQRAIAKEFADWLKSDKVQIRSNRTKDNISGFAVVRSAENKNDMTAFSSLQGFTTVDLGNSPQTGVYNLIAMLENPFSKQYLELFETIWRDKKKLVDVKDAVLAQITEAFTENSPEFIYYITLQNIFSKFLKDISDDDFFADERVGFKNSIIWNKLFDFQRDAALAIINKLERYNGCILADSVGLGKTYTALAVIKYYETRNKSVLVLCPKKLSENWNGFRSNYKNNPLIQDHFRYDVLYHTDLSRTDKNVVSNKINLGLLNWENYDLVVIDESHNFRNGGNSQDKKMNRYRVLLEKVIRSGVKTKVLMLSATPVNNHFVDLQNQLTLAYEDGDSTILEDRLHLRNTIDGIFRNAQVSFHKWGALPPEQRTTDNLLKRLDFDFFELLDGVTISRSRKHIQQYYDIDAIGSFPTRLAPLSVSPKLTNRTDVADYGEIFRQLLSLNLSVYTPSHYIYPARRGLYAQKFGDKLDNREFSQENREQGTRRLMAINLLKRLESSIWSFQLTLDRFYGKIDATLKQIERFLQSNTDSYIENIVDEIASEEETIEEDWFVVGKKTEISLGDMDVRRWAADLTEDRAIVDELKKRISGIAGEQDNKLQTLREIIRKKIVQPINSNNRKLLIFTAFADTAEYLYENIKDFALSLGLHTALVTGTINGKSTVAGLENKYNTILTCFSPQSKGRDAIYTTGVEANADIDILIATDCISEGQNLQDCDLCINYDIHWNPVRIIQRYGRIDRIGSKNARIQLVNFWLDMDLDEYLNLKARVENRMKLVNITATPEERVLSDEEEIDLEYRKVQLEKLKTEVVDIEDMSSNISMSDLGLNDFKLDLLDYSKNKKFTEKNIINVHAVVPASKECPPGMILVLKNIAQRANIKSPNRLHPFYLIYISEQGGIVRNYLDAKATLTIIRYLCKGKSEPYERLCSRFNDETCDGKDMSKYSLLLQQAIRSVIEVKKETDINSLFKKGGTNFHKKDEIQGLDDFELICFLVVK